jgi:hypothetical protein
MIDFLNCNPRFVTLQKANEFMEHFKSTGRLAYGLAVYPYCKKDGKSILNPDWQNARYELKLIPNEPSP